MLEVFKTSVEKETDALFIINLVLEHYPESRVNFDLEDCDKILRIEGVRFISEEIIQLVQLHGFYCEEL